MRMRLMATVQAIAMLALQLAVVGMMWAVQSRPDLHRTQTLMQNQ